MPVLGVAARSGTAGDTLEIPGVAQPFNLGDYKNAKGRTAADRRRGLMGGALGGKTLNESLNDLFRSRQYQEAREKMKMGNLADYATYQAVDMVKKRIEMYEKAAHQEMLRQSPEDPRRCGERET
jgi:hypothetical protein